MSFAIDMQALRESAATHVASRLAANPANPANTPKEISQLATLAVSRPSAEVPARGERSQVESVTRAQCAVDPGLGADRWCWPNSGAMNTAELNAFVARRDRLLRWGYGESEADDLAERLTLRDRQEDDRRMCLECSNLGDMGRCIAASTGRLVGADRRLEPVRTILQRCEAFGLRKGLV